MYKIGIIAPSGVSVDQLEYLSNTITKSSIINIQTTSSLFVIQCILQNKFAKIKINSYLDLDYDTMFDSNNKIEKKDAKINNHINIITDSDTILLLINSSRINKSLDCYGLYGIIKNICKDYSVVSYSGKIIEHAQANKIN